LCRILDIALDPPAAKTEEGEADGHKSAVDTPRPRTIRPRRLRAETDLVSVRTR